MKFPKINSYIASDATTLRKKTIEELEEVEICHFYYQNNDKISMSIIYKIIEEWLDLGQIITTFSYADFIHLPKPKEINLSVNEIFKLVDPKLRNLEKNINHNQLNEILTKSFELVYNAIRILCINYDLSINDVMRKHIKKIVDRGVLE